MIVSNALDAGRLMQMVAEWALPKEIVHLVFPSRRGLLPSVRLFIDHLANGFSALDET